MIDKHGGALLSDLWHYYGIDLRDIFSDDNPLSPRFVLSMIFGLPLDLEFNASQRGGKHYRGWGPAEYALADIATSHRATNYMYLSAHIDPKKSKKPTEPKPFPIPDDVDDKKPKKKPNLFSQMVGSMIATSRRKKKEG